MTDKYDRMNEPIQLEIETTPYGYGLIVTALQTLGANHPSLSQDTDKLVSEIESGIPIAIDRASSEALGEVPDTEGELRVIPEVDDDRPE